jgi:hypothetical protein
MIRKQYWPFDVPPRDKLSPEGYRFISFLETACRENCKAYMIEESVVGAEASGGRSGEVVRRGGGGRWWEIILAENDHILQSNFVDGFEQAAEAVLSWLRGDSVELILQRIQRFLVKSPRGMAAENSAGRGVVLDPAENVHPQKVPERLA